MYIPAHERTATIGDFRNCLRRRQRAYDRHDAAVRALKAFHILVEKAIDVDRPNLPTNSGLRVNEKFMLNLRKLVTYSVGPVFGGPVDEDHQDEKWKEKLNAFSAEKLEKILNFLVESYGSGGPGGNIIDALIWSGILEQRRDGLCITSAGFQFLLKDSFSQLWMLVRSLLFSQFPGKQLEALDLIFRISFASPGREYCDESLNKTQRNLLGELHELGVVMMSDSRKLSFRPTMVGVKLLSSASRVSGSGPSTGDIATVKTAGEIEIFVETNFRVYAYTTSNFQTNLLALFTHMRYRLPGMVVGHLTRDAVRRALMNGISADQIIGYLNSHAHPRMKKGAIPSNVSDEIRLWEEEQHRVRTTPGVLLHEFRASNSFRKILDYANDIGAVLWSDTRAQRLVVDVRSYESIKVFTRSNGLQ